MRALEAPSPAYPGRGWRPKAPGPSVRAWRHALGSEGWTRWTVRDGENGPVGLELGKCRVPTRLERTRTGPAEWVGVTRGPLSDERTWEAQVARDATEHDTRYRYRYSLTPTRVSAAELAEPSWVALARVITAGACIEASCHRGKSAAGMDAYQVRTWEGWHHHMALALLAVWVLVVRQVALQRKLLPYGDMADADASTLFDMRVHCPPSRWKE
jgi:hypothetical protein